MHDKYYIYDQYIQIWKRLKQVRKQKSETRVSGKFLRKF